MPQRCLLLLAIKSHHLSVPHTQKCKQCISVNIGGSLSICVQLWWSISNPVLTERRRHLVSAGAWRSGERQATPALLAVRSMPLLFYHDARPHEEPVFYSQGLFRVHLVLIVGSSQTHAVGNKKLVGCHSCLNSLIFPREFTKSHTTPGRVRWHGSFTELKDSPN